MQVTGVCIYSDDFQVMSLYHTNVKASKLHHYTCPPTESLTQEAMIIGRVQGDPKNCTIKCVCLGDKPDDKPDEKPDDKPGDKPDDKPGDDTVK